MKTIVLGAGVMDTTSAYYLAQAGHEVLELADCKLFDVVDCQV